jgi:chromosome segregation ATPase
LVAENEELKGRLLAYERDGQGQDSLQQGHESLSSQQRGELGAQIAKYKLKERELQEELMMKDKHMMELNEKLTKRNEIVTKLNDKLTKLNEENKQLHISMVIDEEKRKTDQVRAETDREGVKQDVIDAYNKIQRLTHIIHGLNEEIETMKQVHVIIKAFVLLDLHAYIIIIMGVLSI